MKRLHQAGAIWQAEQRGAFDVTPGQPEPDLPPQPATASIFECALIRAEALILLARLTGCRSIHDFKARYA